jgi:biopolymer transport protein ExbD
MDKNSSRVGANRELSDLNTTPLIDVMLVLLVMLIMTLPVQTNVTKMNSPRPGLAQLPSPAITIDIDPDGTIVWNSEPLSGMGALEARFREESRKDPQAQVHLRPSPLANYDRVANVMASAQRNHMTSMGFTDIGDYAN